jgi:type II secretory pathway component GspD/PulD (secretin)
MTTWHVFLIGLGALSLFSIQSQAQDSNHTRQGPSYLAIPDENTLYPLLVRDIDIKEALRLFARNLRIGLVVADEVSGTIIRSDEGVVTRREYLDNRAAEFDFVWYFDGQVLRVSPVGDIETRIIPLRENSGFEAIRILQSLDIYQGKFAHRYDERSRTLMVAGPVAYVELVERATKAFETADRTDITVLRGNEGSTPAALEALRTASSSVDKSSEPARSANSQE